MYDMNSDLLTTIYNNFKAKNNFDHLDDYLQQLSKIYRQNNIQGGLITLSLERIQATQGLNMQNDNTNRTNLKTVFQSATNLIENLKTLELISSQTEFIYGIEDTYSLEEIDLDLLYQFGLRSIAITNKPEITSKNSLTTADGLTEKGYKLIERAIQLKIIIDLCQVNEPTFKEIMTIVKDAKKQHKNPIVQSSYSSTNQKIELTPEQLTCLKNEKGYICLFPISKSKDTFQKELDYIVKEINFDPCRILIASGQLNQKKSIKQQDFTIDNINSQIENFLTENYGIENAHYILSKGPIKLLRRLN